MKLKASVDYGMRIALYLAVKNEICSSREISEEMRVPRDYLIQLALKLRNAGVVKARPGKNGGYCLAKDPGQISIGKILDAFDSDLKHVRQPMKDRKSANETAKAVLKVHSGIARSLEDYLAAISLQDLIEASDNDLDVNKVIASALEAQAKKLREG